MNSFWYLVGALLVVGGVVLGIGVVSTWANGYSCRTKAEAMELEHRFGWLQGCLLKVHGQWVPIANYRVNGAGE